MKNLKEKKKKKSDKDFLKELVDFFIQIGNLKIIKRRGWLLRNVKNPESIADHSFRLALMAWILGKEKGLNTKLLLKMALVHDLCEIYAGDATPYDKILPKDKKKQKELLKKWPRFLKKDEVQVYLEKRKKEYQSLLKLISELSLKRQKEIVNLWLDVQDGFTKEGRFLRQLDKVENLLQALEYYNKDKCFPMEPWWVQVKETIDDPLLLEFIEALSQKFYKKKS